MPLRNLKIIRSYLWSWFSQWIKYKMQGELRRSYIKNWYDTFFWCKIWCNFNWDAKTSTVKNSTNSHRNSIPIPSWIWYTSKDKLRKIMHELLCRSITYRRINVEFPNHKLLEVLAFEHSVQYCVSWFA